MKFAAKIVTGVAVIGLCAPVLAAETPTQAKEPAPVAKTQGRHRHARKVAQHSEKKVEEKKAEKKVESNKPEEKKGQTPATGQKSEQKSQPKAEPAPAAPAPTK